MHLNRWCADRSALFLKKICNHSSMQYTDPAPCSLHTNSGAVQCLSAEEPRLADAYLLLQKALAVAALPVAESAPPLHHAMHATWLAVTLNNMGCLYRALGRGSAAADSFERAAALQPQMHITGKIHQAACLPDSIMRSLNDKSQHRCAVLAGTRCKVHACLTLLENGQYQLAAQCAKEALVALNTEDKRRAAAAAAAAAATHNSSSSSSSDKDQHHHQQQQQHDLLQQGRGSMLQCLHCLAMAEENLGQCITTAFTSMQIAADSHTPCACCS
jgi:tetratricopeptide (TPR) repeat protein